MAAGALTLIWATVVWRWEDPFTALYTMYEQHELAHAYDEKSEPVPDHDVAASRQARSTDENGEEAGHPAGAPPSRAARSRYSHDSIGGTPRKERRSGRSSSRGSD